MPESNRFSPKVKDWKAFELLVAAIEKRMAPKGAVVSSPDRIRDIDTGQLREVDASIRFRAGSVDILITIECRKRSRGSDVTWIEQLATKRTKVGASKTIAVSASRFSQAAIASAQRYGIELRILGEITAEQIDNWLASQPSVHLYKEAHTLTCKVQLSTGQEESFDGMEARFTHPQVNGIFPGAIFLNFLEMKNPSVFSGGHHFEIDLEGQDPELVPIPLGEIRKVGGLSLSVDGTEVPVEALTLVVSIDHHIDLINVGQGKHYSYDAPQSQISTISRYESKMFGLPVSIENFTKETGQSSTTVSWPSGVSTPSRLLNPKLTRVDVIDVSVLHNHPIILKMFGRKPTRGAFLNLPAGHFEDEIHRTEFNQDNFAFIVDSDLRKLRAGHLDGMNTSDFIYEIPKVGVEYVDLTPTIKLLRKQIRGRGSKA